MRSPGLSSATGEVVSRDVILQALTLVAIGFVGTIIWPLSPEAAVAVHALSAPWPPLGIGLAVATGQAIAQGLLFAFGDRLRGRWRWFDRQCARVGARFGTRLHASALALGASSGLLGVPPSSVMATLAPGFGMSAVRLLPLMFATRIVRLTIIAVLARGARAALT